MILSEEGGDQMGCEEGNESVTGFYVFRLGSGCAVMDLGLDSCDVGVGTLAGAELGRPASMEVVIWEECTMRGVGSEPVVAV